MWARHLELALGCWLSLSPFLFRDGAPRGWLDFAAGSAVASSALLSHWRPMRRAHLLTLLVALLLLIEGWLGTRDGASPAHENRIVVGLLLATFAIVPSHASAPPESWQRHR
jgi:hypothetical protein